MLSIPTKNGQPEHPNHTAQHRQHHHQPPQHQSPASKVDKSEASISRTTFAQLRSSYSPYLHSSMARIRPTNHEDICPDFLGACHRTL